MRVEVEWDHIMRWMAFNTNLGNHHEWGFKNASENVTDVVVDAPREGAYLAAFRGFEGKQLPPELGGYKKRYIIQVCGFSWRCGLGIVGGMSGVQRSGANRHSGYEGLSGF